MSNVVLCVYNMEMMGRSSRIHDKRDAGPTFVHVQQSSPNEEARLIIREASPQISLCREEEEE